MAELPSAPPPSPRTLLQVGSPPTKLSTAGRNGLAITISAQPGPHQQVPRLSSSQVQLCLKAPPQQATDSPEAQQEEDGRASSHAMASSSAAAGSGGSGGRATAAAMSAANFSLHLLGDPGAPIALHVSQEWEQVNVFSGNL